MKIPLILLLTALVLPCHAAQTNAPAADTEAAYTKAIEKRTADILALLDMSDPAKSARVHDAIVAQYRALRDWHDANDKKVKAAKPDAAKEITASLKSLHDKFIATLSADLTPEEVEKVKDKMTYGKVQVTYNAYCQMVPNLTDIEKRKILGWLKEAREEAMDAGSANEKSAVFKKYKGRINNYLDKQGHNTKQAEKDFAEKEKASAAEKP